MARYIQSAARLVMAALLLAACAAPAGQPTPTPLPRQATATPAGLLATITEPPAPPQATATLASNRSGVRTFELALDESQAAYVVDEEFFSGAVTRLGKELGLFTTIGATRLITGTLALERLADGAVQLVSGQFSVNIKSLTSDDRLRDDRIREQFLQSNRFPEAHFTATAFENFPADYADGQSAMFSLVGDLTLHGVTRTVTFSTTASLVGDRLTGVAIAPVRMTDFGFDPPEIVGFMKVEDDALIRLDFVFIEVTAP